MKHKLVRITTVPISLEKLLEGQLNYMQDHFDVVAISGDKKELKSLGQDLNVRTYHVEMSRLITPFQDLKAAYKLFKFLRKEKPTIVHSHTPKAGIIGMLAAYCARVPIRLHTVAGLPLMEYDGLKRKMLDQVEKWTYRFANRVYPNSKGLYDFILNEELAPRKKLKIIGNGSSNGIDSSYFNPKLYSESENNILRNRIGISSDSFVYIYVGRIVGDKGINELIRAYTALDEEQKEINTKLLLVGSLESELDPLSAKTHTLMGRNPNIIQVGYQQDVRPFLSISDALVFPSYREGFPNVVMQAGAMGLPSIVSNINGCNEIIENGKNGIIIPVKDTEQLKSAMNKVLIDQELFQLLSINARPSINSRFERKQIWSEILAEYQMLLANL